MNKAGITSKDILEEVPISFVNSVPVQIFLRDLDTNSFKTSALLSSSQSAPTSALVHTEFDRLDMSATPFMESAMSSLIDVSEELNSENNKYHKSVREANKQQNFIQKKKDQGQEGDLLNIKVFVQPSRLDTLLASHQLNLLAEDLSDFAAANLNKLYLAENLHEKAASLSQ